jgi:hypothetical protein
VGARNGRVAARGHRPEGRESVIAAQ